jgi:all-trans-retinol 13,14-reductase
MESVILAVEVLAVVSLVLILASFAMLVRIAFPSASAPNPFQRDHRRPRPNKFADFQTRSKELKLPFSTKLGLAENVWDAIVIGSGIGGLSTAWCLAKSGQRVLVLEQHDMAGGCCHTYKEKEMEFDVGIHYIGNMGEGQKDRFLVDQITEGQVVWAPIDDNYDTVVVGNTEYKWCNSRSKNLEMLCSSFPSIPRRKFEKYFSDMDKGEKLFEKYFILKFLPLWAIKVLRIFGLLRLVIGNTSSYQQSTYEYLRRLIPGDDAESQRAKIVLSYIWGDVGTIPKHVPHPLVSGVQAYFEKGAYYPVGGAGQIAYAIAPTIIKAGGRIVCNALVDEIRIQDGKAIGVRVRDTIISAKKVISAAGVMNTYYKMLGRGALPAAIEGHVQSSLSAFSVFIGLNGTNAELKLPARNYWMYSEKVDYADPFGEISNMDPTIWDDASRCDGIDYPLVFLSFPSAKDPAWELPDLSTAELVSFAPWNWFTEWASEKCGSRSNAYKQRKTNIAAAMWRTACRIHPQLKDATNYFDAASGLTNLHYIGGFQGSIYGLDHDLSRFNVSTFSALRAETDVKNLYLSGQDIASCGFAGGLAGGLVCASAILGRNMFLEMETLWKKTMQSEEKKRV